MDDILTYHSRKGTCVNNKMNDVLIPFNCLSFSPGIVHATSLSHLCFSYYAKVKMSAVKKTKQPIGCKLNQPGL